MAVSDAAGNLLTSPRTAIADRQTCMQEGPCINTAHMQGAVLLTCGWEKPGLLSQTLGEGLSTK